MGEGTRMISVACLMPTLPGRDGLRRIAVDSFCRQQYPSDWSVNLYHDINDKITLGAKLNRMIERCDEEYVLLFDDDDWHSPTRVQRQVEPLIDGLQFTGTSQIYYQDGKQAYLYHGDKNWLGGLAFRRSVWNQVQFDDVSVGCDTRWQRAVRELYWDKLCFLDIADSALFVATIHAGNTSPKRTHGPNWTKIDYQKVKEIMS
jgi:glycosyltransferase involved in cell wall biosynthesis